MNKEVNHILAKMFLSMGVTRCENCGSTWALTWAHRKKRRFYRTTAELTDLHEVLLLCTKCHQQIEYDRTASERLFKLLRG